MKPAMQERMIESEPQHQLNLHDHPCLIYQTNAELEQAFVPYFQAGLVLGQRCLYFVDENPKQFAVDAMRAGAFDIDKYIDSGAFQVLTTKDAHLQHGYFEEQKMLAYWLEALEISQQSGFPGLRAAVEMTWALSGQPGCEGLPSYEAKLNHLFDRHPVTVICSYRRDKFSSEMIKSIIHAHPIVMADGAVLQNPNHVKSDHFVEGDTRLDVQAFLDNLALINKLQDTESQLSEYTRELESARDQAIRANELKTQFVTNISHEIRTPMSGIVGLSELLTRETEGVAQETAKHILQSALNLMHVVNDLLDLSKLEAGRIEIVVDYFSIEQLLEEVFRAFTVAASNKKLTLTSNIDPVLAKQQLVGDSNRLRQVLQNLVQNAIKFTDQGGITIEVEREQTDRGVNDVRFSVRDTGPGISLEDQQRLFQLFVQLDGSATRRHGGTGMGLTLSKRLIELMGGEVGVTSQVDKGSTFWFVVPLKATMNQTSTCYGVTH
jgi:signal transduction histidine kinase